MAKNNKPKGKLIWKILCGVFAFLFAFLMIAGPIANNYATIINMVLGIEGSTIVGDAAEDLPPRFVSDFARPRLPPPTWCAKAWSPTVLCCC